MSIQITNNGTFDIAIGRHRKEMHWKNQQMSWLDLVQRLSATHRTAETHKEYLGAKKPRQDEIKDIGGFVGGYLTSGRRKAGNVAHRQLVTLDIDFGAGDVWADFTMLYGNAAAIYSTHKHTPESPRLRLILPLDRPVFADEYIAIARRIAGNLGVDMFDHTTYQPERLMYWPSTSKDGVYFFDYQDGPWLSADEILASYRDWRDSSEWPASAREGDIVQRSIKKQGDPVEKPGIVGAFCRTYSISEAIDAFLDGVYEHCDLEGRYTYIEGSTSAGLVTYDDKYAYSHHGTDPVNGKLCNAFDLVRLHMYGLQDEDAAADTPVNKLPSYLAMQDFATKDVAVRKQLGAERLESAKGDFAGIDDEPADDNTDWLAELDVDKKGNYLSTINNAMLILNNDPRLKGRLAFNDFEKREVALKALPWRQVTGTDRYLTDRDDAGIRHYLESVYGISSAQKVRDAIDVSLLNNSFHPVRDYLEGLHWDGRHRVDTLLIDYLGAADNIYTQAVTRKTLVAAVARIFNPGCKFDYVLTLVGKQGIGKSTLIKKLGRQWFSDSFNGVQGNQAFEQLQGVWIMEMGELAGLKKAEMETIKHFIAKQDDRYRVAYGRRTENFPRQCIFIGTTNNRDFLRDPTGNRRFWPVDTYEQQPYKSTFTDLTAYDIDQIWAEAVQLYRQGETLFLPPEIEAMAAAVQSEHSEYDERLGLIQKYLDTLLPENWEGMNIYERRSFLAGDDTLQAEGVIRRDRVCIGEIWCEVLGGQQKEMTRYNTKDLHDLMRKMPGWAEYGKIKNRMYGVQRGYARVATKVKSLATETD